MCEAGSLSGRTALVSGAAHRLGREIALVLAGAGAQVVVHYRSSQAGAEAVAGEIGEAGGRAVTVGADLSDAGEAAGLVARAAEAAGAPVDILINNASIFEPGRLTEFSAEALERNVRVNAFAPLALTRGVASQGREADVVNLLDTRVQNYDPANVDYQLGKQMLFHLTRMCALELAPRVRVNGVAPGLILPPPGQGEEYLRRAARSNPLKRWGSAEEVCEAVLFLVRSRFVTGQVIYIDGGQHMRGFSISHE